MAQLLFEQVLNGLQLGVMLFLMAAGLTLVFGIMNLLNLAHGSFYMIGAFLGASVTAHTGSFLLGGLAGLVGAAVIGMVVELVIIRRLYSRDHLHQVLVTYGLVLFFNDATSILFGRDPLYATLPPFLAQSVPFPGGLNYPLYRLLIIGCGLGTAAFLYLLIQHTRAGMLIRAGATNREMTRALGVNIRLLYTAVFGLGALLAAFAGVLAGPVLSVEVGMGEQILIVTFVVIVIGGIGSIRGAMVGALVVGLVDTLVRAFVPTLLGGLIGAEYANAIGRGFSSISIYLLMAIILLVRPLGLIRAR